MSYRVVFSINIFQHPHYANTTLFSIQYCDFNLKFTIQLLKILLQIITIANYPEMMKLYNL